MNKITYTKHCEFCGTEFTTPISAIRLQKLHFQLASAAEMAVLKCDVVYCHCQISF